MRVFVVEALGLPGNEFGFDFAHRTEFDIAIDKGRDRGQDVTAMRPAIADDGDPQCGDTVVIQIVDLGGRDVVAIVNPLQQRFHHSPLFLERIGGMQIQRDAGDSNSHGNSAIVISGTIIPVLGR